MKKIASIFVIIFAAIVFTGCPYDSAVPIDKAEKASRLLLGTWISKTEDGTSTFVVSQTDESSYLIEEKGDKSVFYKGFLTRFDGDLFLNIVNEVDGKKTYNLAKVDMNTNATKVTLSFMSDEIKETFNSSAELKSFIQKNKTQKNFYEKDKLEFNKVN